MPGACCHAPLSHIGAYQPSPRRGQLSTEHLWLYLSHTTLHSRRGFPLLSLPLFENPGEPLKTAWLFVYRSNSNDNQATPFFKTPNIYTPPGAAVTSFPSGCPSDRSIDVKLGPVATQAILPGRHNQLRWRGEGSLEQASVSPRKVLGVGSRRP